MGKVKKTQEKSFMSQLEKTYSEKYQNLTGVPMPMAKKFIKTLIQQAVKESKAEKTFNFPPDCGERMLKAEATDKEIAAKLGKLRKEGVSDDDIRNWWGLNDVERRLLLKLDETNRTGLFLKLTTIDKMSATEANKLVQKYHPIYGDPDDTSQFKGDDRPLPPELRETITRYIEIETSKPLEEQKEKMEKFSSLNARIRHELKAMKR
jgi:hypothetical protein